MITLHFDIYNRSTNMNYFIYTSTILKTIWTWTLLLLLIQLNFSIFIIQAENSFEHLSKSKSLR